VRQVDVGDVLRLGPPVDHMRFDPDSDRDLLLVAGGTGLAPLKSIVDHVARNGPARRVDLFVGVLLEEDLYDRADLARLERENPWLTVNVAVSEDEHSKLMHGDVGEVVARSGPWASREAYVAGAQGMVDDTVDRLLQHGLPEERIRTEVFAPSRPGPDAHGKVTT
jgi:NAD(P)H-flavin reductase